MSALNKPKGLETVRVFALLISVFLGLFVLVSVGISLGMIGGDLTGISFEAWVWLILAAGGFMLSILLRLSVRYVWVAANIYWAAFFLFFAYFMVFFQSLQWLTIPLLVYSLGCLLYFQTRQVKEYFGML